MAPEKETFWVFSRTRTLCFVIYTCARRTQLRLRMANNFFRVFVGLWVGLFVYVFVCRSERDEKCDSNILKMADFAWLLKHLRCWRDITKRAIVWATFYKELRHWEKYSKYI